MVAPAAPVEGATVEAVRQIAAELYETNEVEIRFHPSCFASSGHFAGDDATRTAATLCYANDPGIDAIWFGRGGYGSCRVAESILAGLEPCARNKSYLGYSDLGMILAGLYKAGFANLAHGPMVQDLRRPGGRAAIERALRWLVERSIESLEPSVAAGGRTAAFNLTVLSHLLGTSLEPDLAGHELMVEEVSEQLYRIDRSFFHVTAAPSVRKAKGLRLGRCNFIVPNDPDFILTEEEIAQYWCEQAGVAYLGRADIGHDAQNKVVPFGGYVPQP